MILLNCHPTAPHTLGVVYDFGLYPIEHIFLKLKKWLQDFPEVPQWVGDWELIENDFTLQEQLYYDVVELQTTVQRNVESKNSV